MKSIYGIAIAASTLLALSGAANASVAFTTSYSQDFTTLGTTALTSFNQGEWNAYSYSGSHDTWKSTVAPSSTINSTSSSKITSSLISQTDTSISTISANKGAKVFNFYHSTTPTDRVLGTSPSGNAGTGLQLTLTNGGADLSSLSISYDIVKFSDGQYTNTSYTDKYEEWPGYQLFYKIGSGSWTNVSGLNPIRDNQAANGNPVVKVGTYGKLDYDVTSINDYLLTLNTVWTSGSTLTLMWLDDNCQPFSADQVIGLDNVQISSPVPIPGAVWLFGSALAGLMGLKKRKNA